MDVFWWPHLQCLMWPFCALLLLLLSCPSPFRDLSHLVLVWFTPGGSRQNFEGINYGDRKLRAQMRSGFIDIGRRERKPAAVKAYAPPPPRVGKTCQISWKTLVVPNQASFYIIYVFALSVSVFFHRYSFRVSNMALLYPCIQYWCAPRPPPSYVARQWPCQKLFSIGPCWPGAEPKKMTLKMPKELEMPKMKDHQMFDRARIVELQDELQDKFKKLKVSG